MDIKVPHDSFTSRALSIRTAGFWGGPKLLLDGVPQKGKKNLYEVPDNGGMTRKVQLNHNWLDPIPKLEIDGAPLVLAEPLTWYQYVWMGLPILLLFAGGGLGALFGLYATYASSRVFRSERSVGSKYVLSGLISVGAVIGFFILAIILQLMIGEVTEQ
jgi:hypothetical protein